MRFAKMIGGALGLAGLFLALPLSLAQEADEKPAAKPGELKTFKEKFSYGLGRNIGETIKQQELEIDVAALAEGLKDELAGEELRVPDALKIVQKELRTRAKKRRDEMARKQIEAIPELKALAEKNAKAGAAFLKENQAKDGVKVTESGLQYQVITEGKGAKPTETDVVKTHYHGTLPDGKVFDSTVDGDDPATFPVDGVIDGWTEALQMMPVGSKWRLVVPSKLAYGYGGSGEDIGPNQVLVFEVELLSIETPAANEGGAAGTEPPPVEGKRP